LSTRRKLFWLSLSIGLGIAAYYGLLRSEYRLPFDPVIPFAAVPEQASLLIHLSELKPDSSSLSTGQLWDLDVAVVGFFLDSIGLRQKVNWDDWWLLPQMGRDLTELTYTFIGNAGSGLSAAWHPEQYGPTLGFGEGEIYTFGIATESPIYFARYQNLLVIGRYPFQLENALLAMKGKAPSWQDDPVFRKIYKKSRAWLPGDHQLIIRQSPNGEALPAGWLPGDQLLSASGGTTWAALNIFGTEGQARFEAIVSSPVVPLLNGAAVAWDAVPELVRSCQPLCLKSTAPIVQDNWDTHIASWLAPGAWEMILDIPANPSRLHPSIWVLPIGDSIAYQSFRQDIGRNGLLLDRVDYQFFELQQFREAGPLMALSDRRVWQPWVCEIPGALVVSIFREDMERYLDYFLSNGSLPTQEHFLRLRAALPLDQQSDIQGFSCWNTTPDAPANLWQLLFPAADWSANGCLLYQAQALDDQGWAVQGVVQPAPARQTAVIRWTLSLPTSEHLQLFPVRGKASPVLTGVLAQDDSGKIWALGLNGQIRWTADGYPPLYGPVWEIAGDTPSEERWLATSRQALHVWNEHGKSLSPAVWRDCAPVSGASLFPYPSAKDEVVSFATAAGQLMLVGIAGNPMPGWPVSVGSGFVQSVQHLQLPQEDLLVVSEKTKGWQVFDRQGKLSFQLPAPASNYVGSPGWLLAGGQSTDFQLVLAEPGGRVAVWDRYGKASPVSLGRGPIDHFVYLPVGGDDRGAFVAQRGTLVHLFGYEGQKLAEQWQFLLPLQPDTLLAAAPLGVIAMQAQAKKIWLLDTNGQLCLGCPLAGEGSAYLAGSAATGYQLLTHLDNTLYCYDLLMVEK
jgi:hypothetical protein